MAQKRSSQAAVASVHLTEHGRTLELRPARQLIAEDIDFLRGEMLGYQERTGDAVESLVLMPPRPTADAPDEEAPTLIAKAAHFHDDQLSKGEGHAFEALTLLLKRCGDLRALCTGTTKLGARGLLAVAAALPDCALATFVTGLQNLGAESVFRPWKSTSSYFL